MLPALVPREDFMSAIALNAFTFNGAAMLGPAIAGLLVPVAGYASTFYVNGISFGAVIVALGLMRLPAPASAPRQAGVLRGVTDGLRYIWRNPTVRALTVMAAAFGLFGSPYVFMLPVYRPILDLDERALGFLSSAPGLGAVLGGLMLARFAHARGKGRLLVASVALFVVTLITFATSRSYPVSLTVLILVGALATAFTATTQTLLRPHAGPRGQHVHDHRHRLPAAGRARSGLGDRPDRRPRGAVGGGPGRGHHRPGPGAPTPDPARLENREHRGRAQRGHRTCVIAPRARRGSGGVRAGVDLFVNLQCSKWSNEFWWSVEIRDGEKWTEVVEGTCKRE
jgi:MFS family permease